MRFLCAGIERSLGLGGVVAALHAVIAVADPRPAAVIAKSAGKLASVTGAGLMSTVHGTTSQT
jgi:hypothetical protein